MKISENTLYFVFGIVLMFFATYIFTGESFGQVFFRSILGFIGLIFTLFAMFGMIPDKYFKL